MKRAEVVEYLTGVLRLRDAEHPRPQDAATCRAVAEALLATTGLRCSDDPDPVRDALVEACRKAKRAQEEESADTDGLTDLGMDAHAALADAILLVERGPASAEQRR